MNAIAATEPPSSSIFAMYASASASMSLVSRSMAKAPPSGSTVSATPDS